MTYFEPVPRFVGFLKLIDLHMPCINLQANFAVTTLTANRDLSTIYSSRLSTKLGKNGDLHRASHNNGFVENSPLEHAKYKRENNIPLEKP